MSLQTCIPHGDCGRPYRNPEVCEAQCNLPSPSPSPPPKNVRCAITGNMVICCPSECESCTQCSGDYGCCASDYICEDLPKCSETGKPPCQILDVARNGGVLCTQECGTCGGSDCAQRPGGTDHCCWSGVMNSGRTCDEEEPPCYMKSNWKLETLS